MFKFNTRPHRSVSAPSRMGARILSATGLTASKSLDGLVTDDGRGDQASRDALTPHKETTGSSRSRGEPAPGVKPRSPLGTSSRQMPSVYATMQPTPRTTSAPASFSHPGVFLGPVCGVATTKTTRQLLTQLLQAQTLASVGHPAEQVAAQFDIAQARKALLRRDLKQGRVEDLVETPIERVFESILAEELIKNMPAKLLQPMQQLSSWMAQEIDHLDDPRAERMMKGLVADLRKEHPRPWSAQQPLIGSLCDSQEPWAVKRAALTAFLKSGMSQGIDGLAAMVLLRSSFMGYKAAGLDTTVAPWLKSADRTYQTHILPRKSGKPHSGSPTRITDRMAGITNLGQKSPLEVEHLVAGVRATYRESINLASEDAREAIAFGNPVAAGTSGTTNMFLHAVSHHNAAPGAPKIDASALTTLLASLTCYNGGHSLHEVLTAGHLLSNLPHVDMPEFAGYAAGHARGTFVDLATKYGATALTDMAFERLETHFRETMPI